MRNEATCISVETTYDAEGYVKAKLNGGVKMLKGIRKLYFKIKAVIKGIF